MSNYLDDDDDLGRRRNEREVTLSTGSILGIFFGLALLCALFFGFGYNMGRKSTPVVPVASSPDSGNDSDSGPTTTPPVGAAKPSAGSYAAPAPAVTQPTQSESTEQQQQHAATPATVAAATRPAETTAKPTAAAAPRTPTLGSFGAGNFVVQVAAVSHQEDADLLVSALHRKGYTVAARNESSDKLVHIQVGPFSDRKEADAMKARLISDGYNAMIKQL